MVTKEQRQVWGRKGGIKSNPKKGFGSNPKFAKEMGRKGYLKKVENLRKSEGLGLT